MRKQPRDSWGRFSSFEEEKRGVRMCIRLTSTEAAAMKAAARREDCSVTELVVNLFEKGGQMQSRAVRTARPMT